MNNDLNNIIDLDKIEIIMPKIKSGLDKYIALMDFYNSTNVAKNVEFQKSYNGFYRMRQRTKEFYKEYYELMEKYRNSYVSFEQIIREIYESQGRIEPSFTSKMLATINPNKPIWDKYVLNNLGLKAPYNNGASDDAKIKRLDKTILKYKEIEKWYESFLKTERAMNVIEVFDEYYSYSNISDIKKIDFILWQTR